MKSWRKHTVIGLIVCLMQLSVADLAMARGVKTTTDPTTVKHTVELSGVGTNVEVGFKGGEQVHGAIQSIGEQDFAVAPSDSAVVRHIAYVKVQRLNLTQRSYKASGQPDPGAARRVVAGWGVGSAIRVTLADGRKFKGRIQTMDMDHFSLLPNSHVSPVQVAYTDVQQVGTGGLTTGQNWVIAAGIVGGIAIVVMVVFLAIRASNG
jgi:hypothetical protein